MNVFQMMQLLMPVCEQAVETICKAEGVTPEEAFELLIRHITPGKPNVSALLK